MLAELPDERIAVPGSDVFFGALGGGAVLAEPGGAGTRHTATHRPFFYISSSPWNLFSYLVAFQQGRGLPLGPLMLRDWGFNRATLGGESHGAHKRAVLDQLLSFYPAMRFALIGDEAIGKGIVDTLAGHRSPAVLMQSHGVFAIGGDARAAVKGAVMCEDVARTVHLSRQLGNPLPIPRQAVNALYDRYQNVYGQP